MKPLISKFINIIKPLLVFILYFFCQSFMLSRNIGFNILAIVLTALVLIIAIKHPRVPMRKFKKKVITKALIVISALVAILCLLGLYVYLLSILSIQEPRSYNQYTLIQLAKHNLIRVIIEAVLIGPVFEEVIFRLELIVFKNKIWLTATSIISGLLFAAAHIVGSISVLTLIPYLIISIVFTVTYLVTRDIKCNIILHCLYNSLASLTFI